MTAANPPRRRRRFTPLLLAATVAALLVAAAWNARKNSDDLLMRRATRVVPASIWRAESGYRWVNDHEVLQLMPTKAGGYEPVIWNTTPAPGAPHSRVVVARPALRAPHTVPVSLSPSLSPDGSWLLCKTVSQTTAPSAFFALALDGSKRQRDLSGSEQTGGYQGGGRIVWFADSRRFMSLKLSPDKRVYIGRVIFLHTREATPPFWLPVAALSPFATVGVLQPGRFLAHDTRSDSLTLQDNAVSPSRVTLVELSIDPGYAPARPITVIAPSVTGRNIHNYAVRHLRVSPQGDRVLWEIVTQPIRGGAVTGTRWRSWLERLFPDVWLERLLPNVVRPPDYFYQRQLWTVRLDGRGGLTRLGAITKVKQSIYDWAWTPDGKRISFTHNDALYTVPVDESAP